MQTANPRKQVATLHPFGLPSRLWLYILSKLDIDAVKPWAEIGRKTLNRMIETLVNDQYTIAGKGAFRDEFVTCGGVSLSSVNSKTLESKVCPNLFFAGQMTGVEGYVESAASGLVAGINAARLFKGESEAVYPETTAIGSLAHYITHADSKHFQPMNVNFGIIKELEGERIRDKKARYEKLQSALLAT